MLKSNPEGKTLAELQKIAKEYNIKNVSKYKKQELLTLLLGIFEEKEIPVNTENQKKTDAPKRKTEKAPARKAKKEVAPVEETAAPEEVPASIQPPAEPRAEVNGEAPWRDRS